MSVCAGFLVLACSGTPAPRDTGPDQAGPGGGTGIWDTGDDAPRLELAEAPSPGDLPPPPPGRPWRGQQSALDVDGVVLSAPGETEVAGRYVAALSDVTGDSVPDLAYLHWSGTSYLAHVFSGVGGLRGLNDAPAVRIAPTVPVGGSVAPTAYCGCGDVDGDGQPDLLIGSWTPPIEQLDPLPPSGSVFLLAGPLVGDVDMASESVAWLHSGIDGRANIGTSVAPLGDIDADGYDDFAVGSAIRQLFTSDSEPFVQSTAWVVHGPVSGRAILEEVSRARVNVEIDGDVHAGAWVASAGDQNGDGITDLAIGSPHADVVGISSGAVTILYGPLSGEVSWRDYDAFVVDSGSYHVSAHMGRTVVADADLDGDGHPDLVAGADAYSSAECAAASTLSCGGALVVPGPLVGQVRASHAAMAVVASPDWDTYMGSSMASLGDVDGDGKADVAVGAYEYNHVVVVYGGIEGMHDTRPETSSSDPDVARVRGADGSGFFGYAVSGGQDLDRDGWPDLVIGDPYYRSWTDYSYDFDGRIFVLFGGLH